jgi:hypothetical protein
MLISKDNSGLSYSQFWSPGGSVEGQKHTEDWKTRFWSESLGEIGGGGADRYCVLSSILGFWAGLKGSRHSSRDLCGFSVSWVPTQKGGRTIVAI